MLVMPLALEVSVAHLASISARSDGLIRLVRAVAATVGLIGLAVPI